MARATRDAARPAQLTKAPTLSRAGSAPPISQSKPARTRRAARNGMPKNRRHATTAAPVAPEAPERSPLPEDEEAALLQPGDLTGNVNRVVQLVHSFRALHVKFPKEAHPVPFCYARLVILTGQDVGIRESAEIVGICSRGESFYRHEHSKIQG